MCVMHMCVCILKFGYVSVCQSIFARIWLLWQVFLCSLSCYFPIFLINSVSVVRWPLVIESVICFGLNCRLFAGLVCALGQDADTSYGFMTV